ncbi:TPA: Replication initiation factor family protein, partial [Neisseria lactamica]
EKYSLAGLRDVLRFGFIHEQPDVDLEVELDELGIIGFKQSDKFDSNKRLFDPHHDAETERQYQLYIERMYDFYANQNYVKKEK